MRVQHSDPVPHDAQAAAAQRLQQARRRLVETVLTTDGELGTLERHAPGSLIEDAARDAAESVLSRLENREKRELEEIDAALDRLRTGQYGRCEDCGSDIAPARLAAAPAVRRCLACQEHFEAG